MAHGLAKITYIKDSHRFEKDVLEKVWLAWTKLK